MALYKFRIIIIIIIIMMWTNHARTVGVSAEVGTSRPIYKVVNGPSPHPQ